MNIFKRILGRIVFPFKTQTAILTNTHGSWIVTRPFLRQLRAEYRKANQKLRGYSTDLWFVDEVCKSHGEEDGI